MTKSLLAFAAVALASLAPLAGAGERFVVVPFNALQFDEPLPDRSEDFPSYDPAFQLFEPYVVLDGAGEAYLDFGTDEFLGSWNATPSRVAMRVEPGAPLAGRYFSAESSTGGFAARHFRVADAPDDPSARGSFYAAMETHYQRLLVQGLPGAAWFRHRVEEARAARGVTREMSEAQSSVVPFVARARSSEFDDTFDLFTGSRAMAENLDLDRALRGTKDEDATVDVDTIGGVTTRAMDWKALVKDLHPELDPLSKLIPADQHAVFFPSFEALVRVLDEVDASGTPLLEFASSRAEDQRTKERYQEQLCLQLSGLSRLLGPAIVSSVAITGGDPLLPSGSDIALLFECKQPAVLKSYVMGRHVEATSKGAKSFEGTAGSLKYGGVRSDDRRISSIVATSGDTLIVTNSAAQLQRLSDVLDGKAPALASSDEYVWFRDRYKRGDAGESALLVLTDATIRRWAGPRARIGDSRRVRAAAAMSEIQARHLDQLVAASLAEGAPAAETDLPFSSDFVWSKRGVRSATWGSLEFLTPVSELPLERVTPSEQQAYENFRTGFQNRWRNVFDPIALRVELEGGKLGADVTVMPLAVGTEYREFRDLTRDAKLAPTAGDAHDGTLFHFALAFGKNSPLAELFREGAGPFASQLGADPLGWIGGGMSFYADRDEFWTELAKAEDRDDFLSESFYRLPLALQVEVKDPLKLAAFLTALRAMVDGSAPNMTVWQNKTWHEQGYVRIAVADDVDLSEAIAEAAVYYVATPDAFVLSLREDVLQRAIDRHIARKAGKTDPARERPWLGSSVGLRVERDALDVVGGLSSTPLDESFKIAAWSALPILNEWKRRYPNEDPVALHERLWHVRLTTPNAGTFTWNEALQTMEASDYGSLASPKPGPALPRVIEQFARAEFGLSFEGEGLRARMALERASQ